MASKIILAGEPMALFIAQTEGTLDAIDSFSAAVAGAELNVAIGLTRLGHQAHYMTKLGPDPFGKRIVNTMQANHIDTSLISYSDERLTGFMLKSKVSEGDPAVYYYRKNSAASSISKEDIDNIDFSQYQYLHITGILPALSQSAAEASEYMMKKAKKMGLTVFFDPNLRPTLWECRQQMVDTTNKLAFLADYFLPGIKEGIILAGCDTPESIADYYMQRGTGTVIVKVGEKGAYVASKDEHTYVPGFRVEKVVDTVGAGDGFAAGVISAVMEGLPIAEAARRGNAIGAIQVMSVGDNEGLPTREELEGFMK